METPFLLRRIVYAINRFRNAKCKTCLGDSYFLRCNTCVRKHMGFMPDVVSMENGYFLARINTADVLICNRCDGTGRRRRKLHLGYWRGWGTWFWWVGPGWIIHRPIRRVSQKIGWI